MAESVNLGSIPLFSGLDDGRIELVRAAASRVFGDGQILFAQGDEPNSMFVLLHGNVRILMGDTHLVTRAPVSVVGEQAFVSNSVRTATAVAQGTVQCIELPQAIVAELLESPVFARNLLLAVSEKLAEATNERAFRYRNETMLFAEFKAHVSDSVAQELLSSGKVYGRPRLIDAVILMSDIRDFSTLSAPMAPIDVERELSPYLDLVVEVIHSHGGLVDKFIGDAVLAVWGWAEAMNDSQESLAAAARDCAFEMVTEAAKLTFGGSEIRIGVGLNAGPTFIGNVGGSGKRQFTVLGKDVNLAARLESHTKEVGHSVVASDGLVRRLDSSDPFVRLAPMSFKGAAEPVDLWGWRP